MYLINLMWLNQQLTPTKSHLEIIAVKEKMVKRIKTYWFKHSYQHRQINGTALIKQIIETNIRAKQQTITRLWRPQRAQTRRKHKPNTQQCRQDRQQQCFDQRRRLCLGNFIFRRQMPRHRLVFGRRELQQCQRENGQDRHGQHVSRHQYCRLEHERTDAGE